MHSSSLHNSQERRMRRAASQPLLRHVQEAIDDEDEEDGLDSRISGRAFIDIESIAKQVSCISLHRRDPRRPRGKYGSWKQGQRAGAARLKKQLKSRWAIQKLIDEQLGQFQAHYSRAMAPTRMADVAQILMPKWIPPHELAAVSWLGDWRPSTVLELLRSLFHFLWDPVGIELTLSQLINDIRIEEAVIDEEMTEIQSNCILNLPFGPRKSDDVVVAPPLAQVMSEYKKIHGVIVKAQNLRMKALELAVRKVLSQTDAAEFLVALVGIQDAVHEFSMKCKARSGTVLIKDPGLQSPRKTEYRS
ncbi:uncharacterized protein LOC127262885 isoform X2 [Andrographis paniculata]|uniref:uncharacterized protein LOC127262885 isoform X2 n=1 Tax=Andrographis paniculata TaxID=175694 RepID=UPI0021E7576B|nr:uncharacterized protein LOC127262885 isoform X2 [Andrographis paniculata]